MANLTASFLCGRQIIGNERDGITDIRIREVQFLTECGYKYTARQDPQKTDADVDLSKERRCRLCAVKPLAKFSRNNTSRSGHDSCCKTCAHIRMRGHLIGLSLSELQAHVTAGTLADVPGLLLPHLLREFTNPNSNLGATLVRCVALTDLKRGAIAWGLSAESSATSKQMKVLPPDNACGCLTSQHAHRSGAGTTAPTMQCCMPHRK